MGMKEQIAFPEINHTGGIGYGMDIQFVTTAKTDAKRRRSEGLDCRSPTEEFGPRPLVNRNARRNPWRSVTARSAAH
jgi:hypothetical protein